jgi:lipid A 3-O-deacylase PagL
MTRLLLFTLVLLPVVAHAQSIDHVSVSAIGGKSVTTWHGQMGIAALNIELAHSLSPRTDVAFVLSPTTVHQPRSWFGNEFGDGDETIRALGGSLLVRHTFRMHLYVEGAAGPMWAEKQVPASTSRFNWVSQAGAGFVLMPRSAMPVMIGYRFLHISNGGYAPRNPGVNVSSVVIGTVIRTRR